MKPALVVGATVFASYVYFFQAGGNNQNSRLDLTRALAEHHTTSIDCCHTNTDDKSFSNGHYYSNKSPGQPLLAAPVYAAARILFSDPAALVSINWLTWVATAATSALPMALAVLALLWTARELGASASGALFAALTFALGSPAWAYATLYAGHALATAGLMIGYAAALRLRASPADKRAAVVVGAAAGCAVLSEYGAAPAALVVAAIAVWSDGVRAAKWILLGGMPCLGILMAYQWIAFGSPFATPMQPYFAAKQVVPFVAPSLKALEEILIGDAHGLLPLVPVLLVAPVGYLLIAREHRPFAVGAAAIVGAVALVNLTFWIPGGGWGYGPRYLAPALPFLCLPLAFVWSRGRPALRLLLGLAAMYGGLLALIAVSVKAEPPEYLSPPVSQFLWPAFRDGDLSLNYQSMLENGIADWPQQFRHGVHPHQAFNLGEKLGLRGLASLLPLAGIWLAAALYLWLRSRRVQGKPT